MAVLAGDAVRAAVHVAVDDQPAADAGAQRHADDDLLALRRTEPVLGPGGRVRVVLDDAAAGRSGRQDRASSGSSRHARCGENSTVARVVARSTPPHRRRRATTSCRLRSSLTTSTMISSVSTTSCPGVGPSFAVDHGARLVDDAGRDLRAADVDTDGKRAMLARPRSGARRTGRCAAHAAVCSAARAGRPARPPHAGRRSMHCLATCCRRRHRAMPAARRRRRCPPRQPAR